MMEIARRLPEDERDVLEESDIRPLLSVIEMCRRQRDLTRSMLETAVEDN